MNPRLGEWANDSSLQVRLGASRAASSVAAQAGEEAFVGGDDAGDGLRVGRRVPLVELEGSTEEGAAGPGEHVAGPAGQRILHLGLRLEDGELAARRMKVL